MIYRFFFFGPAVYNNIDFSSFAFPHIICCIKGSKRPIVIKPPVETVFVFMYVCLLDYLLNLMNRFSYPLNPQGLHVGEFSRFLPSRAVEEKFFGEAAGYTIAITSPDESHYFRER